MNCIVKVQELVVELCFMRILNQDLEKNSKCLNANKLILNVKNTKCLWKNRNVVENVSLQEI